MEELPEPASGQFLEISFRRLLKSCEEIIKGDNKMRPDLDDWQTSPVFHHYVDTLQEQLSDLRSSCSDGLSSEVLASYQQHVNSISDKLQPASLPAYCKTANLFTSKASPVVAGGAGLLMPVPVGAALGSDVGLAGPSNLRQRMPKASLDQLQASTRTRLETQSHLQDVLTAEMVDMAANLKQNAVALEKSVRDRGTLLEETETNLEKSVASAKDISTKAKNTHTRGKRGFCFTCMILVVVGLSFVPMYIFIKVTSMAGYKAS